MIKFDKKYGDMKIAVFGREPWTEPVAEAVSFLSRLESEGASICCHNSFASSLRSAGEPLAGCTCFSGAEDLPADVDIFLALGGDGTFLSSLEFVRGRDIPVCGINFGTLGFLTAAKAESEVAAALAAGRFTVQNRSLLRVSADGLPEDFWPCALNEISFQRAGAGLLSIEVSVDGRVLPAYWADGILIATPTGSTAYSLSLGGPVVTPECEVMLITPIASHNLNQRPLVVPLASRVEVKVTGRSDIMLAADNRFVRFGGSLCATVSKGDAPLRYVSFTDNSFITALRSKLLWGADSRNNG